VLYLEKWLGLLLQNCKQGNTSHDIHQKPDGFYPLVAKAIVVFSNQYNTTAWFNMMTPM
jgi:hypothetical protein